ncbi:MAG: transposase [Bacteroidota bacterium]
MPNHFHFLIKTTNQSVEIRNIGSLKMNAITNGFRVLLSSYSQAINKQEGRSGSLFRQKTKFKLLEPSNENYPRICFNYIHQNPLTAGLVAKMEDWEFSSFRDYADIRSGSLCNQKLAYYLLDSDRERFYEESYQLIDAKKAHAIF